MYTNLSKSEYVEVDSLLDVRTEDGIRPLIGEDGLPPYFGDDDIRTIYGQDHRREVPALNSNFFKSTELGVNVADLAKIYLNSLAVGLIVSERELMSVPNTDTFILRTETLNSNIETRFVAPLCTTERFRHSPSVFYRGSGFFIGPRTFISAGHIFKYRSLDDYRRDPKSYRIVTGFKTNVKGNIETRIHKSQVFEITEIRSKNTANDDWAVIKVHQNLDIKAYPTFEDSKKIVNGTQLYVIGHPLGLSMKFADTAEIKRIGKNGTMLYANLDTLGGNSGSPVFNAENHKVIGVLTESKQDFKLKNGCYSSNVVKDSHSVLGGAFNIHKINI